MCFRLRRLSCKKPPTPLDTPVCLFFQVTNISDLRVNSEGVAAGDRLDVRLGAKLSRGNRVMTMYETLWTKGGRLVAHGEISLFCMDNESRRFCTVPPWVQEVVMIPSAAAANAE